MKKTMTRGFTEKDYILPAGGSITLSLSEVSVVTFTGSYGTAGTLVINGNPFVVKNLAGGSFYCGRFVWDFGGSQEHEFSQENEDITSLSSDFNFLVSWKGCGSHIFQIVPIGFVSPSSMLSPLVFQSNPTILDVEVFYSLFASSSAYFLGVPGGILTWTNRKTNGSTEIHGLRIHETVECPLNPRTLLGLSSKLNNELERISGGDTLSPAYKSPSVFKNKQGDARVVAASNGLPMFSFNDTDMKSGKFPKNSQYAPRKIVGEAHRNNEVSSCIYLESGNIYFTNRLDEDFMSSSSSSES